MERWNIGRMGFGKLLYWANGRIHLDDKLKMNNILLKPTIPSFHYSAKASLRAYYSTIETKIQE